MSVLLTVTRGKVQTPDLMIVYGVDGVGKSTFAAQAPDVIFLGGEQGTNNLDVARFPNINKYQDVLVAIQALTHEAHTFRSLALDSLDWLEPLVWDKVCDDASAPNIEAAYGGYGKGYVAANKIWQDLMQRLSVLRETKKMNIIVIAHAQVKPFNDPQHNASYDRYQLKLNDKASALWREYVDCVFFANFEIYTKEDKNKKRVRWATGPAYCTRREGRATTLRIGSAFHHVYLWIGTLIRQLKRLDLLRSPR